MNVHFIWKSSILWFWDTVCVLGFIPFKCRVTKSGCFTPNPTDQKNNLLLHPLLRTFKINLLDVYKYKGRFPFNLNLRNVDYVKRTCGRLFISRVKLIVHRNRDLKDRLPCCLLVRAAHQCWDTIKRRYLVLKFVFVWYSMILWYTSIKWCAIVKNKHIEI